MAIINPLPYTIANGDPVDATPVMADLNQIVADTNANAAPVVGNASQEFLVATTTNPAGAVPLLQAQQQFAVFGGSSSQTLNVAPATTPTEATQLQQTVGNGANAPTNVTGSRTLGTTYQNTSTRPLVVSVYVQAQFINANNITHLYGFSSASSSLTISDLTTSAYLSNTLGSTNSFNLAIQFIVPPKCYYIVSAADVSASGTYSIITWREY